MATNDEGNMSQLPWPVMPALDVVLRDRTTNVLAEQAAYRRLHEELLPLVSSPTRGEITAQLKTAYLALIQADAYCNIVLREIKISQEANDAKST